jgi:GNAT superfamily N-acetyltransferase
MNIVIRNLQSEDAETFSTAFREMGWNKPVSQFIQYHKDQSQGDREVLVALVDGQTAGYATILWRSQYPSFSREGIPEVQDLNVFSAFRNKGVASFLLNEAELRISRSHSVAGIGVGLHPGYNVAQRLYVKRGYVPNGKGVTYEYQPVDEGVAYRFDDSLVLWLTKDLAIAGDLNPL